MSVSISNEPGSARESVARDTMQFRAFAIAIIGLNGGLLVLASRQLGSLSTTDSLELAGWAVLVAAAGFLPLRSRGGPALAMDLPLLLAAAFIFGPFGSGLVALVGTLDIRELKHEISALRSVWNRSQTSLSVMTASLVFTYFGDLGDWPQAPIAALLALAADAAVNYLIVGYGTSLRTGDSLTGAIRMMRIGTLWSFLISYLCFGFLGLLIAEAYQVFGFAGVVASIAPVALGSQAFFRKARLHDAEQTLAESTVALRNVDERIAAERRDERARIAAALHDEVLQDLYNVTIRAQVLRQDLMSGRLLDLEDDLPPVIRASELAVEDLRSVIHGLRSADVGHAGLVETLTLFARHLEKESGLQIVLSLDADTQSTAERELVVYQICREAMTNAAQHSGGRTIWVSLHPAENATELLVEDDGCGFESEAPPNRHHFGLQLMSERALSIGATMQIRSSPGSGTVVRLVF
jgi:signal transduction histidine kinase